MVACTPCRMTLSPIRKFLWAIHTLRTYWSAITITLLILREDLRLHSGCSPTCLVLPLSHWQSKPKPQGPALVPPASGHFPHCSSLWCSFLVRFTTLSAYLGCCAISVWDPMRSSKGLPLHTFSEKDSDPSGTIKHLVSKWTSHLGTYGTLFSPTKRRPVEQNLPSFLLPFIL